MNDESSVPHALGALAGLAGITTAYWDAGGTHRVVPEATLRTLLASLGVLEEAEALVLKFVGESGPLTSHIRMALAQVLALSGEHEAADQTLESAAETGTVRRQLARARLDLERSGSEAALRRLQGEPVDRAEVMKEPELVWRYRTLQKDGVPLPDLPTRSD